MGAVKLAVLTKTTVDILRETQSVPVLRPDKELLVGCVLQVGGGEEKDEAEKEE